MDAERKVSNFHAYMLKIPRKMPPSKNGGRHCHAAGGMAATAFWRHCRPFVYPYQNDRAKLAL